MILRTGFLHAGQCVSGLADRGRFKVNLPPHALQPPSHNSYSYRGMSRSPKSEVRSPKET
jgi:hypothetical protein